MGIFRTSPADSLYVEANGNSHDSTIQTLHFPYIPSQCHERLMTFKRRTDC